MSLVLGDDDLLREILHRLGPPTALLCAALVSRRWLRHASDPAFLRAFRARHPALMLGFLCNDVSRTSSGGGGGDEDCLHSINL